MLKFKISFPDWIKQKMLESLIKKVSISDLKEQSFISKLKQKSGIVYVSKIQEMMSDLGKN